MFSIVIPLYNKEKHIAKTIHSVIKQSVQDFEIIIVDDGSTDNSVNKVKKFDDDRIRIVHQENAGVSAARNRGIEEAQHELIAFLDADDEWLPNHLEEITRLRDEFPQCDVFATNYKIIDSKRNERLPVDTNKLGLPADRGILPDYFDTAIKTAPPLWTSAVIVNKEAIKKVGGFPLYVTSGEDLLTWARLACQYKIAYSKKVTAIYHFFAIDEWLMTARKQDEEDIVGTELEKLLINFRGDHTELKKYIALWYRMRLHNFMKAGDRINATREVQKIFKYSKTDYRSYVLYSLTLMPEKIRTYILLKRAEKLKKRSKLIL